MAESDGYIVDNWYTTKQIAEMEGVKRQAVTIAKQNGYLKARQVGRNMYYDPESYKAWSESRKASKVVEVE